MPADSAGAFQRNRFIKPQALKLETTQAEDGCVKCEHHQRGYRHAEMVPISHAPPCRVPPASLMLFLHPDVVYSADVPRAPGINDPVSEREIEKIAHDQFVMARGTRAPEYIIQSAR